MLVEVESGEFPERGVDFLGRGGGQLSDDVLNGKVAGLPGECFDVSNEERNERGDRFEVGEEAGAARGDGCELQFGLESRSGGTNRGGGKRRGRQSQRTADLRRRRSAMGGGLASDARCSASMRYS